MIFRFDQFTVNAGTFEVFRSGNRLPVQPQVFDLLIFLIQNRHRTVTKDEVFEVVWKGRLVSEATLSSRINAVRRLLGDDGSAQRFVRTVHGRGFRFVHDLTAEESGEAPAEDAARSGASNVADQASEIRYARCGDINIAYQVVGAGPIDIVVAPGYMSHIEQDWRWPDNARFLQRLASFARVILFDRRGTGLSDRPVSTSGFDEVMDDITAVMDAAKSQRAVLLGGAEGGPMCILFAAAFPQRTHALVLVASYARRMWAPDYPWGLSEAKHRRILETYEERWGREPAGIHLIAPTLADVPGFAEWYTTAQRYGGSPGAALAWYRITMAIDVRHVLPVVRAPTLVLHRTGDRVQPVESGRYLARHIPGARYVELPGHDHFWFAGDADGILSEIEAFLSDTRYGLESDRVLVTVLITDIAPTTAQPAPLRDRARRDLLARYHAMARAELGRWRGREVEATANGLLATFDAPGRAIRCAAAIRDAARSLGIEIRAGLHTGECELSGDRLTGTALHIGTEVAGQAGPGEVLVTGTVKDLVAGSGIAFDEHGEHGLQGVPEQWRLYTVISQGNTS